MNLDKTWELYSPNVGRPNSKCNCHGCFEQTTRAGGQNTWFWIKIYMSMKQEIEVFVMCLFSIFEVYIFHFSVFVKLSMSVHVRTSGICQNALVVIKELTDTAVSSEKFFTYIFNFLKIIRVLTINTFFLILSAVDERFTFHINVFLS